MYFYGAGCTLIDYMDMAAKSFGEAETGVIPDGAVFAVVDLFTGANATFELSIADA